METNFFMKLIICLVLCVSSSVQFNSSSSSSSSSSSQNQSCTSSDYFSHQKDKITKFYFQHDGSSALLYLADHAYLVAFATDENNHQTIWRLEIQQKSSQVCLSKINNFNDSGAVEYQPKSITTLKDFYEQAQEIKGDYNLILNNCYHFTDNVINKFANNPSTNQWKMLQKPINIGVKIVIAHFILLHFGLLPL